MDARKNGLEGDRKVERLMERSLVLIKRLVRKLDFGVGSLCSADPDASDEAKLADDSSVKAGVLLCSAEY